MNTAFNSAVTGLNNFQKMLDVVSNNIANVNTTGFKHSKINFQELYSQTLRPATAPREAGGGTNAMQVGLGSTLATIDNVMTQGIIELTDSPTDLAIAGDGFFVIDGGANDAYTRNGHFSLDASGTLVDSGGRSLKGWSADAAGVIDPTASTGPLRIPFGDSMTAQATSNMKMVGNLDGGQAIYVPAVPAVVGPPPVAAVPASGGIFTTEATIYDSLGQDYRIQMTFTKVAAPVGAAAGWAWSADSGVPAVNLGTGTAAFDPQGNFLASASTAAPSFTLTPTNGADPLVVIPDFSTVTQLVTSGKYTVASGSQDGYPAGTLTNFSIGADGILVGQYSNALTRNLGQVALAYFANPQGLERGTGGLSAETINSGKPQLGSPGDSPRGTLMSGALESSNVDLSKEFTRLITAQRAFQANSKVITTMDSVLEEVNNLKR